MRLKKTRFSDIVWFLYGITVLTFSALIFTETAGFFFLDKGMGLLFTAAIFLISSGLVILRFYLQTKKPAKKENKANSKVLNILTFVFAFVCLIAGIFLRLRQIQNASFAPEISGSVSEEIYYSIFYSLSALFGGDFVTVIIFNTVLTVVFSVCLFFAMRKILGNFAALLSVCFAFVSPYFCTFGLSKGPELLSLVFDMLALLFISLLLPGRKAKAPIAILAGFFIGLAVFADFSAIAFLLFIPMLFVRDKVEEPGSKNKSFVNAALLIPGAILGIGFEAFVLAMLKGNPFLNEVLSFVSGIRPFANKVHIFASSDLAGLSIAALLLIPGIAAGYASRKKDQGTAVALILIGFCVLDSLGFSGINGGCEMAAILLFAGMAGNLFDMLSYKEPVPETEATLEVKDTLTEVDLDKEPESEAEEAKEAVGIKEETEVKTASENKTKTEEKIEEDLREGQAPLENPLPVPKKKERGQVDYDYYVADNADYDI